MSKKYSKPLVPKTPEEALANGGIQISKLRPGSKIYIETTIGSLFTICLLDNFDQSVRFWSSDERFRTRGEVNCYFLCSVFSKDLTVADWIVKGAKLQFRFADGDFQTTPVLTAMVEGNGWKYEAITK